MSRLVNEKGEPITDTALARKRCCCNCRRCNQTEWGGFVKLYCEVDGHSIGYVECFAGWCRHWAKERREE